jgi:hypothetical protein
MDIGTILQEEESQTKVPFPAGEMQRCITFLEDRYDLAEKISSFLHIFVD